MPLHQVEYFLTRIQSDSSFKAAYARSFTRALFHNQIAPKNKRYKICSDVFVTVPVVIQTKKDFYLLEKINEKIEDLKAAGLMDYWNFKDIDRKLRNTENEGSEPKILNIDQFLGGFQVFVIGVVLSLVAFIVENLYLKFINKNL